MQQHAGQRGDPALQPFHPGLGARVRARGGIAHAAMGAWGVQARMGSQGQAVGGAIVSRGEAGRMKGGLRGPGFRSVRPRLAP